VSAADSLPEFRVHPEMLPHELGLLVWAAPVGERTSLAGRSLRVIAASWAPLAAGIWLTLYDDTAAIVADESLEVGEQQLRERGWLAEGISTLLPWSQRVALIADGPPGDAHRRALLTLVTTWLLMGQTLTVSQVEPLPRADARRNAPAATRPPLSAPWRCARRSHRRGPPAPANGTGGTAGWSPGTGGGSTTPRSMNTGRRPAAARRARLHPAPLAAGAACRAPSPKDSLNNYLVLFGRVGSSAGAPMMV